MGEELEQYIRRLAHDQRLSLTELAERAGMSRQSLYCLWQSDRHPNLSKIIELANALGVHPLRLLEHYFASTGSGDPTDEGLGPIRWSGDRAAALQALLVHTSDAVLAINAYRQVVLTNPSAVRLFRLPEEQTRNFPAQRVLAEQVVQRAAEICTATTEPNNGGHAAGCETLRFRAPFSDHGTARSLTAHLVRLRLEQANVTLVLCPTARSEENTLGRVGSGASASQQALTGPCSQAGGLSARKELLEQMARARAFADWLDGPMALLLIELEGLQGVEKEFGADIKHSLLTQAAERARSTLRRTDRVIEVTEQTLAVILTGVSDTDGVKGVAQRLLDTTRVADPDSEFAALACKPRVAGAVYPDDAQEPMQLLDLAWSTLDDAQRLDREIYFAGPALVHGCSDQLALLNEIREALARQSLELRYEPIHELNSGRCVGLEALPYWEHPEHGLIPPDQLLRSGRHSGLLPELQSWMLKQALADLALFHEHGVHVPLLTLNISAEGLSTDWFAPEALRRRIDAVRMPGESVEIEIAEQELAPVKSATVQRMAALQAAGICIALDQFGEGHAPLFALPSLPIDRLKVACPSIPASSSSPGPLGLASVVARLAGQSSLTLSATEIDSRQAAVQFHNLGFDYAQGPYFAPPLHRKEVAHYLASSTATTG